MAIYPPYHHHQEYRIYAPTRTVHLSIHLLPLSLLPSISPSVPRCLPDCLSGRLSVSARIICTLEFYIAYVYVLFPSPNFNPSPSLKSKSPALPIQSLLPLPLARSCFLMSHVQCPLSLPALLLPPPRTDLLTRACCTLYCILILCFSLSPNLVRLVSSRLLAGCVGPAIHQFNSALRPLSREAGPGQMHATQRIYSVVRTRSPPASIGWFLIP